MTPGGREDRGAFELKRQLNLKSSANSVMEQSIMSPKICGEESTEQASVYGREVCRERKKKYACGDARQLGNKLFAEISGAYFTTSLDPLRVLVLGELMDSIYELAVC